MKSFIIEVLDDKGVRHVLGRQFESADQARHALLHGEVDPYSGIRTKFSKVLSIEEGELTYEEGAPNSLEELEAKPDPSESIILTTSFLVAGREIDYEIEVITAECVYGMNIFKDILAGLRDVFGGRSAATQKVLRDARKTCLLELKREALLVGADAVIAVDLDYSEFSGGGKNGMLFLVASGTAVKLKDR